MPSLIYNARSEELSIPRSLLRAVDALHPQVALDLYICGNFELCLEVLAQGSCLRSCNLNLIWPWRYPGHSKFQHPPTEKLLHQFIDNQPHLNSLHLRAEHGLGFNLPEGWPFPRMLKLENLGIDGLKPRDKPSLDIPWNIVDGYTIRTLTLRCLNVMETALNSLGSSMPNLAAFHSDNPQRILIDETKFACLHDFLTRSTLRQFVIKNVVQDLPWPDMVVASGSELQTPLIYNTIRQPDRGRRLSSSPATKDQILKHYLEVKEPLGFTDTDLLRLSSVCPNLEHLGFDATDGDFRKLISVD